MTHLTKVKYLKPLEIHTWTCRQIVIRMAKYGYILTEADARIIWQNHSDSVGLGWAKLPENDNDLRHQVLAWVEEVDEAEAAAAAADAEPRRGEQGTCRHCGQMITHLGRMGWQHAHTARCEHIAEPR